MRDKSCKLVPEGEFLAPLGSAQQLRQYSVFREMCRNIRAAEQVLASPQTDQCWPEAGVPNLIQYWYISLEQHWVVQVV